MIASGNTSNDMGTQDGRVKFQTTAWEMVINAHVATDGSTRTSLGLLIERYWRPIYCFIRQFGNTHEVAKDYTQDFFADFIERDIVSYADKSRGKFRTFLLASVKRYLAQQHRSAKTLPPVVNIPELEIIEQMESFAPMGNENPEDVFDKNWAKCILENSIARLYNECIALNKEARFQVFEKRFLADPNSFMPYKNIAALLGLTETAVRKHLEWTKKALARIIREEISQSIGGDQCASTEIKELMLAL